jgi:hypothetical protein
VRSSQRSNSAALPVVSAQSRRSRGKGSMFCSNVSIVHGIVWTNERISKRLMMVSESSDLLQVRCSHCSDRLAPLSIRRPSRREFLVSAKQVNAGRTILACYKTRRLLIVSARNTADPRPASEARMPTRTRLAMYSSVVQSPSEPRPVRRQLNSVAAHCCMPAQQFV